MAIVILNNRHFKAWMQGLVTILVNTEFNYFEVNIVIFQKFIEIHFLNGLPKYFRWYLLMCVLNIKMKQIWTNVSHWITQQLAYMLFMY